MNWWTRFTNWLQGSEPGGRKEQVEDWLEANQSVLLNFFQRQNARRNAYGHYFQRLKGWRRPSDNPDDPDNDFAGKLPAWCDVTVDVWDGPKGKGWVLRIWVTEANDTVWTLSYDSDAGLLGWQEIKPAVFP
jgi:hypothetical protein